jgi:hypothetical protein
MIKVLAWMYLDILEFHKRAIRFFSGQGKKSPLFNALIVLIQSLVWRQIFRAAWKDFDARFKGTLESLRRHKDLIESQATVIHFQQYQADTRKFMQQLDNQEKIERERKYLRSLEWISGAQSKLDHESFCDTRKEFPGSGKWILTQEDIQNWKDEDIPMTSALWLNGIPGAGKTNLFLYHVPRRNQC